MAATGREGESCMNRVSLTIAVGLSSLFAAAAGAGEIPVLLHEAQGGGWANVFDGGPLRFDTESTSGPDDTLMLFGAVDRTRLGNLGAVFDTFGRSWITNDDEDTGLNVRVWFAAEYVPSFFPGGDRPGGAGAGLLRSVIEFVMPTEELEWVYWLDLTEDSGFEGSTEVVFENVTQSRTILTLTGEVLPAVETVLRGEVGDVIRITSMMSGGGTVPADVTSAGVYGGELSAYFAVIPEPGTTSLLGVGALFLVRRRSRGARERVA
jgi:PEP-CTERM motif